MEAHKDDYPVALMARVLQVSRSGYYAWRRRVPSKRQLHNQRLAECIEAVFTASRATYRSPRVHATLREQGIAAGRHRVARLMRRAGLVARVRKRRYPRTTDSRHGYPVADNLLARQFGACEAHSKWVADITYLPTCEGWLYLAVVMDLFSRRVVGWGSLGQRPWSMATHLRTELVLTALQAALAKRLPASSGLLFHSERASQYASWAYQQALSAAGITCSMSRSGNCLDNAVAESFFGTLKVELVYRLGPMDRRQMRTTVAEWLEVFYNRQRRHSALGYRSPEEYERHYGKEVQLSKAAVSQPTVH
jgi:transposase InsO family protein